jgi:hypothetical protein
MPVVELILPRQDLQTLVQIIILLAAVLAIMIHTPLMVR